MFMIGSPFAWATSFEFSNLSEVMMQRSEKFYQQIELGFESDSAVQFAYERGEWWTSILFEALNRTEQAIFSEDFEALEFWSKVRDYKPSTRMVVPDVSAVVALDEYVSGSLSAGEAWGAYRNEVHSAYELNMRNSLNKAEEAFDTGFYSIFAYEVALAEGYFSILESVYLEQMGSENQTRMIELFSKLRDSIYEQDYSQVLEVISEVKGLFQGFQAAELSEDDQLKKASQIMSFLRLVPIEYTRGVSGTTVVVPFEVQEAVTFMDGAIFAFSELQLSSSEIDEEKTLAVAASMEEIAKYLSDANKGTKVVETEVVSAAVEELVALIESYWPSDWLEDRGVDMNVVYSLFGQIEDAVAQSDYEQAEIHRLTAYALYDVGLELRLMALNPPLAAEIEGRFWSGYEGGVGLASVIKEKLSLEEVKVAVIDLKSSIKEGQDFLGKDQNPITVIVNSAVIVFREGLEAILIIFALIGGMCFSSDKLGYKKPLITGVILGLIASVLTWLVMQGIIYRFITLGEKLEAIVSIIAIIVLFVITNWFFHDVYWNKWNIGLQKKKFSLMKKTREGNIEKNAKYFGFLLLGLTSVYREGFETVLFLQVLVLDAGVWTVMEGLALGGVCLAIVGYITFRMQKSLPYLKMLIVTGFMIVGILVIMVGKTIHTMQIVGWLSLTPVDGLVVPYWVGLWFGVFATWESLLGQVASILFVGGSYLVAERMERKKKGTKTIIQKMRG